MVRQSIDNFLHYIITTIRHSCRIMAPTTSTTESLRHQPVRNRGVYSADRVFNSVSPIVDRDIQTFLAQCIHNWSVYSEQAKHGIITSLPPSYQLFDVDAEGKLVCPISDQFVREDRVIKDNIATFQRDVKEGYYTKTWQEKARRAMEERAKGCFDGYLMSHAEEMFGKKDPITDEDNVAESSDGIYDNETPKTKRKVQNKSTAKQARRIEREARGSVMPAEIDMDDESGSPVSEG